MVKDAQIAELVLQLSDHYKANVSTRFLRPYIAGIFIDDELSRRISELTEQPDSVITQGVHLEELYPQLHAISRFIYLVRIDVLPNIRLLGPPSLAYDINKVYREMALNNFGANIRTLADYTTRLYSIARMRDEAENGQKHAVWRDFPYLTEIDRYLTER